MASASHDASICVITATLDAENQLPHLIDCLYNQTDKDFQWIVADGGSNDATLELLADIQDMDVTITSQSDFGIYDAFNRAIKLTKSDYYIIVGADDILYSNAIKDFRCAIKTSKADIITCQVLSDDKLLTTNLKSTLLYGQAAYITSHSVGAAFKTVLHQKFGYYSNKFPIAADQLFVKQACKGGATVYQAEFISGEFNHSGISNQDIAGTLSEIFRIQLLTEENKTLQFIIYILRLLKNTMRIIK